MGTRPHFPVGTSNLFFSRKRRGSGRKHMGERRREKRPLPLLRGGGRCTSRGLLPARSLAGGWPTGSTGLRPRAVARRGTGHPPPSGRHGGANAGRSQTLAEGGPDRPPHHRAPCCPALHGPPTVPLRPFCGASCCSAPPQPPSWLF